jgi:transposase
VRLIPAAYVKPFVRRNKTDVRDAAAICTALKQPDMRFVRIKSGAQQAARGLERSRELLVRQHPQLRNSGRGQLAEHGLVAAQGRRGLAPPCSKPGPRNPSGPAVIDRRKQAGSMTAPHPVPTRQISSPKGGRPYMTVPSVAPKFLFGWRGIGAGRGSRVVWS